MGFLDVVDTPVLWDAESMGIIGGVNANTVERLNETLQQAKELGIAGIQLRPLNYDMTSDRLLVPGGVTLAGDPNGGTRFLGGAFSIMSEGTIRDVTVDDGWTEYPSAFVKETGNPGGVAITGGRIINVQRENPSSTQLYPARNPHGQLTNTIAALKNDDGGKKKLKVGLYGHSLVEGAGGEPYWFFSMFDPANSIDNGGSGLYLGDHFNYQPTRPGNLEIRAIGGTTSWLLAPHIAVSRKVVNAGSATATKTTTADGTRYGQTPHVGEYDLIIVSDMVNNYSNDPTPAWPLEAFVKTCRDAGTDVILIAEYGRRDLDKMDDFTGNRELLQRIAAAYGAVFIDMAGAFQVAYHLGHSTWLDLFVDPIHMSTKGHNIWAQAVLNALFDYTPDLPSSYNPPKRRVHLPTTMPAHCTDTTIWEARYEPTNQSAGVTKVATAGTDTPSVKHPRYWTDGTHSFTPGATPVFNIPQGDYVEFAVENAVDLVLFFEQQASPPTIGFSFQDSTGTKTIHTGVVFTGNNTGRHMGQNVSRATFTQNGQTAVNGTVRVTAVTGTIKLLGAFFEVMPKRGPFRHPMGGLAHADRTGTWGLNPISQLGVTNLDYTDTVGDSIDVDVDGDSIYIALGTSPHAGQVKVTVDDVVWEASRELYLAGRTELSMITIPGRGQGRHRVSLQLVGVNGSAQAVSASNTFGRRLTVYEVSGILSDNRSTLADLTAL